MTMAVRDRETLRSYVRLAGVSQRELATRAGVAPATVNHLLSGRRGTCSEATATALEEVLQCPPGLFFAPVDAAGPRPAAVLATGAVRR